MLLVVDVLAESRGLQETECHHNIFDLFLLANAFVDLLLEVRQPLDFDLFMSHFFQFLTARFKITFLASDISLQFVVLLLELLRPR